MTSNECYHHSKYKDHNEAMSAMTNIVREINHEYFKSI
jgi:hypothetical protein